ncbi:uncharacterized protein F4812DRAFT_435708 [Daldinia caldariorum]|uniref:uncharacterized protein n=1 Tax=Daldinia caldariorum TaxID=326644 RepID=UPI0020078296|nr:uncharacterized protein F4812DRAFT_435708 [Daldinia caldariorum]KAI1466041.1 hypothetical protein F4812DRAFT_435708 [Daldinia caldariorum]
MAAQQPRTGLSLYANLLEPEGDSSTSISRAPVVSQEALEAVKEQEATKKPIDPALRFQPHPQIRRPQQKTQKPKPAFPKVPTVPNASNIPGVVAAPPKSTLADWAPTEEDEYMYGTVERRARGGRKKKKKKAEDVPVETDWDEIYDPSRPTNVDEYLRSDERIREVREWKDLLYKHKRRDDDDYDNDERRGSWDSEEEDRAPVQNQFAPPGSYSFAPPPPSPPRASIPDDKTGDDAYARRLAMSQGAVPPPPRSPTPPPPPPPPPPPAQAAPPPELETATISRAPVRYTQPQPPAPPDPDAMDEDRDEDEYVPPDLPSNSEEAPEQRANNTRSRDKGFAARLMAKYGWSKGQGLGAEATGILQPLRVEVEKRKKKSDAEGGGWAGPGGRGRIIGSKTGEAAQQQQQSEGSSSSSGKSKFGPMSNVVVLRNMLEGMEDLQAEMESGLGQEIGEECGDKYGRVERLYIDVEGRRVYIKFTDQVSALRAVNALDGRIFAGNTIQPQFYDVDKFEQRIYE